MYITTQRVSVEDFENNFENIINSVIDNDEVINVNTENGNVVIISDKYYVSLLEKANIN